MTTDLIFFEQYIPLIAVATTIFFLTYFIMWLKLHYKIKQTLNDYNKLETKNTDLNLQLALLQQKLTDSFSSLEKEQKEKEQWQIIATDSEREYSAFKATALAKEENLNEKIIFLENMKEELTLKFKNISSDIIKAQHESFTAEQKNTLNVVINPFAQQLEKFKAEVIATREEGIKNKSSLDTQLNKLVELNQNLSLDAQNLTEALKGGKKLQGNWGECQLNRILDISGLRKGQDYETQESFISEDKKIYRPDVIVHLPENRDIIIDSKVSLNDYLEAVSTEDELTSKNAMQKNVASIKAHIDELSAKEYQKLLKEKTLNYVIMFIPIESAYIAALDYDRYIYDYAYKKNIILATPLSLLPTLRTIENLWRIDSQNQNVQKIAELGGKIYDKLSAFIEDMKKLERGMNQANQSYKDAMTKLTGRGGAVLQAEKMKQLGAKTSKIINLTLNDDDLALEETKQPLLLDATEDQGE